jgi:uncharacterized secreted protein with C-terminal beta-propeller domain
MLYVLLLLAAVSAVYVIAPFYPGGFEASESQLKRFSSYEELKSFVRASLQAPYEGWGGWMERFGPLLSTAKEVGVPAPTAPSYSTTNVQVEGVDEADIVKTDGEYIYIASEESVVILKAYPPEEARVLSQIRPNGTLRGVFINGDKLAVFEQFSPYEMPKPLIKREPMPYEAFGTSIKVYDVSDRERPVLKREISLEGYYFNSRMIGDYVYVVINQPAWYRQEEDEVALPKIRSSRGVEEVPASEVYYSDVPDRFYVFTTVVAVNVQKDEEEPTHETFLLGATSNMYVSLDNIYITVPGVAKKTLSGVVNGVERTIIYKIHVEGRKIECDASGEVPGRVLNQFSMDEHNGYFRIATATGHIARNWEEATSRNHVYILDMSLNVVGRLEDLAPGETIYSARFMGDRCYLVTFRKVDPLFVIDLRDPTDPKVLGKLKITGYSDYLHPYDESHIIGIGKETVAAEEGDFAWYQGVKISLFDVSDVSKPKEITKYEIGDRGTESPVLRDHKALLFDRSRSLLVMPVLVAEIDEEKYPNGVPPNTYGDYVWQGAYVFNLSLDKGLVLKGRITHLDDDTHLMKSGYYFSSPYSVKRSLYIENVLYTISDKKIKMNSLENLDEINEVEVP